jgi:diphthamide synthase (EF-2-diphthine--ammonia ligase)
MKALVAWSSGKDSAWALHEARRSGNFEMVGALTTVTDAFGRVSMHGIREELLRAQLDAAGLPAFVLYIPFPCPNEVYEQKMSAALEDARAFGVTHMIFGDLFLADVRAYRERHLAGSGITPVFPVWGRQTAALAREMIGSGKKLPGSFAGRKFDGSLLASLPAGVDPCGENGEFHSFVSAGPMFSRDLTIRVGETIERDGFAYADLLLA